MKVKETKDYLADLIKIASVSEIALDVTFETLSDFESFFKKEAGTFETKAQNLETRMASIKNLEQKKKKEEKVKPTISMIGLDEQVEITITDVKDAFEKYEGYLEDPVGFAQVVTELRKALEKQTPPAFSKYNLWYYDQIGDEKVKKMVYDFSKIIWDQTITILDTDYYTTEDYAENRRSEVHEFFLLIQKRTKGLKDINRSETPEIWLTQLDNYLKQ